ncbi:transposase [Comamonas thiooxydans]|nr:transposase [Comamonas thiooxydans]
MELRIRGVYDEHKGRYGYSRITAALCKSRMRTKTWTTRRCNGCLPAYGQLKGRRSIKMNSVTVLGMSLFARRAGLLNGYGIKVPVA